VNQKLFKIANIWENGIVIPHSKASGQRTPHCGVDL